MPTTTALALRASVAAAIALALTACSSTAATEPEAPTTPSTSVPAPSSVPPATDPAPSEPDAQLFESQDGAVRFTLPEGWSVDDRSAMGEASEMYNRGPGWLNELVLLDDDGDQMLWYREDYGNDSVDCYTLPADIAVAADPLSPELRAEDEANAAAIGQEPTEFQIRSGLERGVEWDGQQDVATGEWFASLDLMQHNVSADEDCGWAEELGAGGRMAMIGAVGDHATDGGARSPIVFDSEQAARDWFESDEVATLIEVLSSVEFTGTPILDTAP